MSFISVFDVLGPNMIGPSSSHTAGAAVIAGLARKLIAPPLTRVAFTLYGSFAKTYRGHGTDRALLGASWALPPTTPGSGTPSGWPGSGGWPSPLPPTKPRPSCTPTPWTSAWRTPPAGS